ncbi:MAG: glycerate kinase [Promethearchaeota archaeon]
MLIKNQSQILLKNLNTNQLYFRKIGLKCIEKAINAVKPDKLIKKSVKIHEGKLIIKNDVFELKDFEKIYIIGGGKASAEMVFSLEKLFINNSALPYKGIINIPEGLEIKKSNLTGKININFASHPIPNENGLNGTKQIMKLIQKATKNDLIICLISGGGSALLLLPKPGISLKEVQNINSLLLASGASIHEINAIRKHISDFKGGNLAKKVYNLSRATLISLIISDVVGDDLSTIASGPTVPDLTTFKDTIEILKKYNIYEKSPFSIKTYLEVGMNDKKIENPKPNDACFNNIHNYLIGSIKFAIQELFQYLDEQSFKVESFPNEIIGEAREYGKTLYQIISQKLEENGRKERSNKIAIIGNGELTVTLRGSGIGGRNQEMLLSFLDYIKDKNFFHDFCIIAVNLDGIEGNSKSMGVIVDKFTLNQVISKNLDTKKYLENNDSNSFFKILKSDLITGPTGCNVNDLVLILISNEN